MVDWKQIDTVLLDMDGTLLDLAFDNFFWQEYVPSQYALARDMSREQADRLIHEWVHSHRGTLNWYCLDFWTQELDLDVAALKRGVADRIRYRPGAERFLAALGEGARELIMVTNAHPEVLRLKSERTGVDRYFEHLVCSHDYGAAKEEQSFWERLRAEHDFDPQRTLLVDDSLPVLSAARHYGVAHLWSILHPDSSLPPRDTEDTRPFPAIDRFDTVLPE